MQTTELPASVTKALGSKAAKDFANWLNKRLHSVEAEQQTPISSFIARQKVNVLMLEQVSNLLLAGKPTLEEKEPGRPVWRVPVHLTLPAQGSIGVVGEVEVDAQLGVVQYSDSLLTQIANETQHYMSHLPTPRE